MPSLLAPPSSSPPLRAAQGTLRGRRFDGGGTRRRIHSARVGDDLHAFLDDRGQHALHRTDEISRVPEGRVALLLLLKDRHGDFGQVVEHQVVDRPSLYLAPRCIEIVTPEPLTACHANYSLQWLSPRCGGRTNGPRWGPGLWSVARRARLSISRVFSGYTIAST